MAGFTLKVSKDKDVIKERTGSAFIGSSGVYDITINFVSLDQSERGSISFNLNIDYNGNTQTIYGSTIQNNDGSQNKVGYERLNKLLIIAGLEDGDEPTIEEETHNVGKDNKPQEFMVIQELSDLECKIQVKQEFSKYNGQIKEALVPYNFFRVDGATAEEIAQAEEDDSIKFGTQLQKILDKEATTKPIYRENKGTGEGAPTEAEVAAYLEAKKSGKKQQPSTVKKPAFKGFKRK